MHIQKIICGGQTGIDRMAIEVARVLNIPTGGTAAKGFMTENGPDYTLIDFGLKEHTIGGYPPRTRQNVLDAEGTVMYGDINSTGTRLTKQYCIQFSRPYIENPTPEQLDNFLGEYVIQTLNVAGNRASKMTQQHLEEYRQLFRASLEYHLQKAMHNQKGQSRRL